MGVRNRTAGRDKMKTPALSFAFAVVGVLAVLWVANALGWEITDGETIIIGILLVIAVSD